MRSRSRSRIIHLGLLAALVGFVLFVLGIRASRLLAMADIAPFSVPSPTVDVPLMPDPAQFESQDALKVWRGQLIRGLVNVLVVLAYYLGFCGFVFGLLSVLGVAGATRDREAVGRAFGRLVGDSVVRTVALLALLTWTVLFNPWVWPVALELFIIVSVGGGTFVVLAALTMEVFRREEATVRILVAYPLTIGTAVLPLVAAGLASPTFGQFLRAATTVLAVFLLDTVLSVGGLAAFLRRQFRLTGVAAFLTWAGVILVLGWTIGAGAVALRRYRRAG